MKLVWTLIAKDLRLFQRDRLALGFTILLPILLASVMGSAMSSMSGGGGATPRVRLLVQDEDQSEASQALIEMLGDADGLSTEASADARPQVRNGDAPAALVIPPGFGAELAAGRIGATRLLRDPASPISQQVIAGHLVFALARVQFETGGLALMTSALDEFGFPVEGRAEATDILSSTWNQFESLAVDLEAQGSSPDPDVRADSDSSTGSNLLARGPELLGVVSEDVAGANDATKPPDGAGISHAFAAMAVMMLMFNLVAAGGGLLDEEASGSLLRLRLSPAGGLELLMAKLGFVFLVGLLQLSVLFPFGWLVFDLPLGAHLPEVLVISIALCLAVAAMGMVFATASRTRKQLEGVSTIIILIMSAVGGAWFPREITPAWFRALGSWTVTAWAMDAYHAALWYGKGLIAKDGLDSIAPQVGVLLAFAVLFTTISVLLFRRRFGSRT